MIYPEPKLIAVDSFTAAGVSVRTINSDEFKPNKAKLPALWDHFISSGLAEKIPNRLPESQILGLYSNYDSDATGFYTVTAGVQIIHKKNPLDYSIVEIQKGNYLVFEAVGTFPQVVIETWGRVWAFFEENTLYKRCFKTDFEKYLGHDQIAIYIGITK